MKTQDPKRAALIAVLPLAVAVWFASVVSAPSAPEAAACAFLETCRADDSRSPASPEAAVADAPAIVGIVNSQSAQGASALRRPGRAKVLRSIDPVAGANASRAGTVNRILLGFASDLSAARAGLISYGRTAPPPPLA